MNYHRIGRAKTCLTKLFRSCPSKLYGDIFKNTDRLLRGCLYEKRDRIKKGTGRLLSRLHRKNQAGQFSVRKSKQESKTIN